jgi:aminoglycoside phosphotransferase family enzyme
MPGFRRAQRHIYIPKENAVFAGRVSSKSKVEFGEDHLTINSMCILYGMSILKCIDFEKEFRNADYLIIRHDIGYCFA